MWYLPEMFEIDATYATYTVALVLSGLLSIIMSAATGALSAGRRVLGVLLGVAMLGYGFYLYFFLPAEYWIAWMVFALPLLVVVNAVRAIFEQRNAAAAGTDEGEQTPVADLAAGPAFGTAPGTALGEQTTPPGGATFTDPVDRAPGTPDGVTPPTR